MGEPQRLIAVEIVKHPAVKGRIQALYLSCAVVVEASEQARQFCLRHGQTPRLANHVALCIEERASNTVQYGFTEAPGKYHLSLRILFQKDYWVLRFRDDCRAFDPTRYVPAEGGDALGLRLIQSMSQEAHYTYSLNMNNLMLRLPSGSAEENNNTKD